jgi:hypothetical protein
MRINNLWTRFVKTFINNDKVFMLILLLLVAVISGLILGLGISCFWIK